MLMNTNEEINSVRTEWIQKILTKTGSKYIARIKDDCIEKVIPKCLLPAYQSRLTGEETLVEYHAFVGVDNKPVIGQWRYVKHNACDVCETRPKFNDVLCELCYRHRH